MVLTFEITEYNPRPPLSNSLKDFNFKIVSQNMNSMNLSELGSSRNGDRLHTKLVAILKGRADIYALQDLRLGDNVDDFKNQLILTAFGSYTAYLNSQNSSRGVGVLIKNSLRHKVYRIHSSACENIQIIEMSVGDRFFNLINIYGPKVSQNNNFYNELRSYLESINCVNYCIMGDMNVITNVIPPNHFENNNIELFNAVLIPNETLSRQLVDWLSTGEICDRFRTLYPFKKIFSYESFQLNYYKRSRIDNVLCCNLFSDCITKIDYPNRYSSMLDHKPIEIFIGGPRPKSEKRIDNTLLDISGLHETVYYALVETLIDHAEIENKADLKQQLVLINVMCHNMKRLSIHIDQQTVPDQLALNSLEFLTLQHRRACENFIPYNEILDFNFNIEWDALLETLTNTFKNSIIAFQSFHVKQIKEKKDFYSKKLLNLYANGNFVSHEALQTQEILLSIEDQENKRLLKSSKYFNLLNHEKPTRGFSALLKNQNSDASISNIKSYDGVPFESEEQRNEHIRAHYENLYSTPYFSDNTIEDFLLGIDDDLINQHKLNDLERESLEGYFTEIELQESLDTSNFASAPGADGISMLAIKTFWNLLKIPILRGFNEMIDKGVLRGILKFGRIRLIPKGDKDTAVVGNWRPISLLCTLYKLFSGIVNLRIRKVVNKVCHRAQKAYGEFSVIQENILISLETMNKANKVNCPLAALLIDFSRAFDTVAHSYIRKVFKYFGFGDRFIEIIMITLKDRSACIIVEGGKVTESFLIRVGVLQGDRPSCEIFKICINPLILKFIHSVILQLPPQIAPPIEDLSGRRIDKADNTSAFADDLTLFFSTNPMALILSKQILDSFGTLSHLKTNVSKTKVITFGPPPPQDFIDAINELGFQRADSFETLGIKLNNKLDNLNENWDRILNKCKRIVNFWNLFFLSTPGRVNIVKQFLYSQLSYLGSILTPPDYFFEQFTDLIVRFLKHAAKVARDRIFIDCKEGGLGLVDPRIFVLSLQVNMFMRGFKTKDWWGNELRSFLFEKSLPHSINFNNLTPRLNPILHILAKAFYTFAKGFFKHNGNIKSLQVFGNDFYTNFAIDSNFFDQRTWNRIKDTFVLIKYGHIVDQNANLVDFNTFLARTGCNLPYPDFLRVADFITPTLNAEKLNFSKKNVPISTILNRTKLKSKIFRPFLSVSRFKISNCRPSKSRNLWSENVLDPQRESRFFLSWTKSFVPMNIREFAFKFLNNFLHLNANRARMLQNENLAKCYFCENHPVGLMQIIPHENYRHFFLQCRTSDEVLRVYFRDFLDRGSFQWFIWNRNLMLLGAPSFLENERALVLNLELILAAFFLFQCKLRKLCPSINKLKEHCEFYREIFLFAPAYKRGFNRWTGRN